MQYAVCQIQNNTDIQNDADGVRNAGANCSYCYYLCAQVIGFFGSYLCVILNLNSTIVVRGTSRIPTTELRCILLAFIGNNMQVCKYIS